MIDNRSGRSSYPGLLYSEVNTILTIDASRKSLPRISTDEDFASGRAEAGCTASHAEFGGPGAKAALNGPLIVSPDHQPVPCRILCEAVATLQPWPGDGFHSSSSSRVFIAL